MKKVCMVVVIAATLASCEKPLPFNQGTQIFDYTPTNLEPVRIALIGTTTTVYLNNGTSFAIEALSPSKTSGQCFILEAPLMPGVWTWDQQANVYKPEEFAWNTRYGFSSDQATVYFLYRSNLGVVNVYKVAAKWFGHPDASGWVRSFNAPGRISNRSFPVMGTIVRSTLDGSYIVSLP
jgi:hypothetical protein